MLPEYTGVALPLHLVKLDQSWSIVLKITLIHLVFYVTEPNIIAHVAVTLKTLSLVISYEVLGWLV